MNFIFSLLVGIAIIPLTTMAQNTIIDPSQVPACISQCALIIQAQQLCSPPVTAQKDTECFCNSNNLVPLRSGATTGVCDGACNAQEMTAFISYFRGLCDSPESNNNPASAPAPAPAPAAAGDANTTPAPTTVQSAAATSSDINLQASGNSNIGYSSLNGSSQKSWFATHYRWVIFAIVLIVTSILAIILGTWYKRRRSQKHQRYRTSVLATTDANHVLRDPHPSPSPTPSAPGTMSSNMAASPIGAFSSPSPSSIHRNSMRRLSGLRNETVLSPSASTSDLKFDDSMSNILEQVEPEAPSPPQRKNSKLQRKPSTLASTSPTPPKSPT